MKVSLNTTFDGMAFAVGPSNVPTTAHAAGISTTCGGQKTLQGADGTTNFGIGIGDYPVHPIDQAVGFATSPTAGSSTAPTSSKVTDSPAVSCYTHKAAPKQVDGPAAWPTT